MKLNPLPILISGVGIYFFFKLGGLFILHPIRLLRVARRALCREGAGRSLCLALAGTLGVGNIFGVALGIILGGVGSVLWLFISTLFAAVIKYAEVTLSADIDREAHLGMIGAIRDKLGGAISLLYALLVLALSLTMGAAIQSASAGACYNYSSARPSYLFGILLGSLVLFVIIGGFDRISRVTSFVIPASTIIYIIITLSIIIKHADGIGEALSYIVKDAFTVRGALGGFFGFITSASLREGYSRGILSNEAGSGTSSLAHAGAAECTPAERGVLGIIEVVFDTALLCTLTALTVVISLGDASGYTEPMSLVLDAVSASLGRWAIYPVTAAVYCFAFSTVISWYYYGEVAYRYLFRGRNRSTFLLLFVTFVLLGTLVGTTAFVPITDLALLVMSLICLFALIKSSDRIKALSEQEGIIYSIRILETGEAGSAESFSLISLSERGGVMTRSSFSLSMNCTEPKTSRTFFSHSFENAR